ncbi:MAG: hypothetical protein JWN11_1537 [Hyphomicrobiales bacterium]|nr:hypothetical protein [Hyphomicrobiales bacterium]
MNSVIDVRSLRKSFGPIDAVNGVTFSVGKGEILGFLGPNGAGKSTTMKIITGYMPSTSGEVRINGSDIRQDPIACKRQIGYLPEGAPLYGEMTTAALLDFTADIRRMGGELKRRRIREVVGALELQSVLLRRIETLSKGFKRRVGLAQAVLHDPDILILDEPTDGLDPNQKHQVRQLIRGMGRDKAIIISTHLLEEVDAVCDRAIIIDQGRIVLEGTPAELHARGIDRSTAMVRVRAAAAERAVTVLKAITGVTKVAREGRAEDTQLLVVDAAKGVAPLEAISAALGTAGIGILELQSRTGRLDETFRRVTGADAERTA